MMIVTFDGKEDLLASDVDRFWTSFADAIGSGSSERVVPVRELLEHTATTRDFQRSLRASGKYAEVSRPERFTSRAESSSVSPGRRARAISRAPICRQSRSVHAAALRALVEWWLAEPQPISAADALFHRLFWKSLHT